MLDLEMSSYGLSAVVRTAVRQFTVDRGWRVGPATAMLRRLFVMTRTPQSDCSNSFLNTACGEFVSLLVRRGDISGLCCGASYSGAFLAAKT